MATAMKNLVPPEQGGIFRVLVGAHVDQGPPGCECEHCRRSKGHDHQYEAYSTYLARMRQAGQADQALEPKKYDNDLVESRVDLERRFNVGEFSRKFARVNDPVPPAAYPLEKMTVAQLLTVCEEEEIEHKGEAKKEKLLALIQAARKTA